MTENKVNSKPASLAVNKASPLTLLDVEDPIVGSIWSVRGNHARWRQTHGQDIRRTPRAFFEELDAEFHFTVDVASLPDNALCERFWTPEDNGLEQDWTGERCWMNPPYSHIGIWAAKAAREKALTVGLLPVRTDLAWFHDSVLAAGAEVRFIRGRLRFYGDRVDGAVPEGRGNAPFPSMVVIWRACKTDGRDTEA